MFVTYEVSIEVIKLLRPVVAAVQIHDADLADQLKRAASSISLNLAEGMGSAKGNKQKHYSIARGSANEVRAAIQTAQAWGWIDDASGIEPVLDRLLALLWGLTHPK